MTLQCSWQWRKRMSGVAPSPGELVDLIHFMVFSFVRPTVSELFAIRHRHVTVADDPLRLIIKIVKGKTGGRETFTLSECVDVYERICQRFPQRSPDDFIFLPNYSNRKTANRQMQNQFNLALARAGLKVDPETGLKHSLYSLRHTAICMRNHKVRRASQCLYACSERGHFSRPD